MGTGEGRKAFWIFLVPNKEKCQNYRLIAGEVFLQLIVLIHLIILFLLLQSFYFSQRAIFSHFIHIYIYIL